LECLLVDIRKVRVNRIPLPNHGSCHSNAGRKRQARGLALRSKPRMGKREKEHNPRVRAFEKVDVRIKIPDRGVSTRAA